MFICRLYAIRYKDIRYQDTMTLGSPIVSRAKRSQRDSITCNNHFILTLYIT